MVVCFTFYILTAVFQKSFLLFRIIEARETFTTLLEISRLLNTGLDNETLAICVRLCEQVPLTAVLPEPVKRNRTDSDK